MEQVFQCFGLYMAFLLSSFRQETTIEPPVVFSLKLLWAGHWLLGSVQGMQYILNMAVNAKISEGLIHKLSFEGFRIWPLVLWPLWEDFEKLAFAEEYL